MTNKAPSPITNLTAEEKLRTLLQDQAQRNAERRKDTGTFLSHTHSDEGGRFAKPQQIVGSKPVPEYPAGPNWAPQAVGVEPPLGMDVNEMEPVGRQDEIEASIASLERAATQQGLPSPEGRDVEAAGSVAHHNVEPPPNQSPTQPSRAFATVFAPSRRKHPR